MSIAYKITKDNPVFLYRLINSSTNKKSPGSYKEFICTLAWADHRDQCYGYNYIILRYMYRGKLHKIKVSDEPLCDIEDSSVFATWSWTVEDEVVLQLCKEWISKKIAKRSEEINRLAWRTIHDRDFLYSLEVQDHVSEL